MKKTLACCREEVEWIAYFSFAEDKRIFLEEMEECGG